MICQPYQQACDVHRGVGANGAGNLAAVEPLLRHGLFDVQHAGAESDRLADHQGAMRAHVGEHGQGRRGRKLDQARLDHLDGGHDCADRRLDLALRVG